MKLGKVVVFVLAICFVSPAWGSGYQVDVQDMSSATNYTGGCTATGSLDGKTIPSCASGSDGTFDIDIGVSTLASDSVSASCDGVGFTNEGGLSSGNVCFKCAFVSIDSNVDITTIAGLSIPAGNTTAVISKALSGCSSSAHTFCVTGAAAASKPVYNSGTSASCNGSTECKRRKTIVRVTHQSSGNCTGGAATAVTVPLLNLSIL